jgi:hypothetical protein
MINKYENINGGINWDYICVPHGKQSGLSNNTEWMEEEDTEDLLKEKVRKVIFSCYAFSCMSLYTSLNGAMTAYIAHLNFRNLSMKWPTSKEW